MCAQPAGSELQHADDATCGSGGEGDDDSGDGPPAALRALAEQALQRYAKLHRAILDPADHSVQKRFLVLQPLLGMGNSQIEEVTALLIAMVTKRALVIDLFDRRCDNAPGCWTLLSVHEGTFHDSCII